MEDDLNSKIEKLIISIMLLHGRKKKNLSQQEVALKANISRPTYVKFEQGLSNPSLGLALKVFKVLDIDHSRIGEMLSLFSDEVEE